jgi:hypothetical protein
MFDMDAVEKWRKEKGSSASSEPRLSLAHSIRFSVPEPFCLDLRHSHVLSTFFLTFLPAGLNIFATWLGPRILSPRLLVAAPRIK